VIALLDRLGVRKAHHFGYSMGGDIAAWLVIEYPERFASVTLGASSGFRNWTAERDRATEALGL
jgi:pimeloyl-ACP methyl ester carboxylesterase